MDPVGMPVAVPTRDQFWDLSLDPMVVLDMLAGRLVDVNPAWTSTLGWSREEALARPYLDFVHPEDRVGTEVVRQELVGGLEVLRFENRFLVQGGGYRLLEWSASSDGRFVFACGRDVTDHRRLEDELRRQAQALDQQHRHAQTLIDRLPAGVTYIDRNFVFRQCNPALARFFGKPLSEVLDRPVLEVLPGAESDIVAPYTQVRETLQPLELSALPVTYELHGKARQTFWDATIMPQLDDHGAFSGWLVFALEVSDQIRAERLQAETERHKNEFLGVLSHELRTPLNAIQGFGSILEDGVAGPLEPTQARFVEKILQASESMLALVNDLLDMSRLTAGKFRLSRRRTALSEVVHEACAIAAPTAQAKNQLLELEVPTDLPPVSGDPQRLTQVVDNLVTNAIKYTPAGGRVLVRARADGGWVQLDVIDTGIGIAPAEFDRIFQTFTQVDMSSTRNTGGVGLGLSIVKSLVDAHGGTVGVESTEGEGSRFWVRLPIWQDPA